MFAAENNCYKNSRALINCKGEETLNWIDKNGFSAILHAANANHFDIVRCFFSMMQI